MTTTPAMFCYQCEQTAKGTGCTVQGVCGKSPEVAALQDLLLYATKGLSSYAHRARKLGVVDHEIDVFVLEALFTTVTNVDFDPERLAGYIRKAVDLRDRAKQAYEDACAKSGTAPEALTGPAAFAPAADVAGLVAQAAEVGILVRKEGQGDDVTGLQELITYGLKGTAAYADHAQILGQEDDAVYAFFHEMLAWLAGNPTDVDELTAAALKVGEVNLKVMGLLDAANTGVYGDPEPTVVRVTPVKGKCILVSVSYTHLTLPTN